MHTQSQDRLLIKILIGVAWLDDRVQPEERRFLARVLQAHQLAGDTELESLLDGKIAMTQAECESWIQEYLGGRSIYDDDRLIEAISAIVYMDGDIANIEAKLLVDLQSSPTAITPTATSSSIAKLQQLYRNWVEKIAPSQKTSRP
jgi:uncharacterized tellurite resistance protein B-like protein